MHRVVDGVDASNDFRFPANYVLPEQKSVTVIINFLS